MQVFRRSSPASPATGWLQSVSSKTNRYSNGLGATFPPRTTAFVANTQALATTAKQRAFALGTLAGAAGNFFGSGYLNAVVGGPRRSHELRHRLAAYSVGDWLRDNEPNYSGTLAETRAALTFGESGTPGLPSDLKAIAQDALQRTYSSGTAALPDLDTGYRNLLEHLSLLGDFTLPPVPPPMNNTLTSEVLTQGIQLGDNNPHPGGSGLGTNNPGIGAHEKASAVCEEILLWLVYPGQWLQAIFNALGGQGSNNTDRPGVTASGLSAASQSPAALSAINSLYGISLSFWQALAARPVRLLCSEDCFIRMTPI